MFQRIHSFGWNTILNRIHLTQPFDVSISYQKPSSEEAGTQHPEELSISFLE